MYHNTALKFLITLLRRDSSNVPVNDDYLVDKDWLYLNHQPWVILPCGLRVRVHIPILIEVKLSLVNGSR